MTDRSGPIRPLPALDELKAQARRLRKALEAEGNFISHSEALELVAHQMGHRDWNTLHAAAGNRRPVPLALGAKVSGHYLGQAFTGEIVALSRLGDGTRWRVALDLDEPVGVVRFESFSAFRRRINGTVDNSGVSAAKTSDGEPHLKLAL